MRTRVLESRIILSTESHHVHDAVFARNLAFQTKKIRFSLQEYHFLQNGEFSSTLTGRGLDLPAACLSVRQGGRYVAQAGLESI